MKLTYADGTEIEGIWMEATDHEGRPSAVMRLDDGTLHREPDGDIRRRVVRKAND